jgi:hypothetical protein
MVTERGSVIALPPRQKAGRTAVMVLFDGSVSGYPTWRCYPTRPSGKRSCPARCPSRSARRFDKPDANEPVALADDRALSHG